MDMAEVSYCEKHPRVETNLRCGKCGELICPDCMVHTPVGVRCEDCGKTRRIPTYDVSGQFLTRAAIAGLILGIAFGFLFLLVFRIVPQVIPGLGFGRVLGVLWPVLFAGAGLATGRAISLAVNRKRGRPLKIVAAGSVLTAYLIMSFFGVVDNSLFGLLATAAGFYLAVNRF